MRGNWPSSQISTTYCTTCMHVCSTFNPPTAEYSLKKTATPPQNATKARLLYIPVLATKDAIATWTTDAVTRDLRCQLTFRRYFHGHYRTISWWSCTSLRPLSHEYHSIWREGEEECFVLFRPIAPNFPLKVGVVFSPAGVLRQFLRLLLLVRIVAMETESSHQFTRCSLLIYNQHQQSTNRC